MVAYEIPGVFHSKNNVCMLLEIGSANSSRSTEVQDRVRVPLNASLAVLT